MCNVPLVYLFVQIRDTVVNLENVHELLAKRARDRAVGKKRKPASQRRTLVSGFCLLLSPSPLFCLADQTDRTNCSHLGTNGMVGTYMEIALHIRLRAAAVGLPVTLELFVGRAHLGRMCCVKIFG